MRDLIDEPLVLTAIVAIVFVSVVAAIDAFNDGNVSPGVLALLGVMLAPIVPAMLAKYGSKNGNGKPPRDDHEDRRR